MQNLMECKSRQKVLQEYRILDRLSTDGTQKCEQKETERVFCAPTVNKTCDFAIRPNKSLPNKISIRKMNLAQRIELRNCGGNSMKEGRKEGKADRSRTRPGGESNFFENLSILGIYASLGIDSEEPREPARDCAISRNRPPRPD